jgi:serine/threonine protein kinase
MRLSDGKPFVSLKLFQVIEILDNTACGPLSVVQLTSTKQNYHLQTVSKKFLYSSDYQDHFRDHLTLITQLSHPNLVSVQAWLEDLENVYVLIEYFEEEKKLSAALARNRFGSMYLESPTICAIKQLLGVVRYLHSRSPPIFHGTISAQKIFDAKNLPRLGGLLLSSVELQNVCEYAAPEQLN